MRCAFGRENAASGSPVSSRVILNCCFIEIYSWGCLASVKTYYVNYDLSNADMFRDFGHWIGSACVGVLCNGKEGFMLWLKEDQTEKAWKILTVYMAV